MSDLVGNPEDRFSRVVAQTELDMLQTETVHYVKLVAANEIRQYMSAKSIKPVFGVSDQVQHVPACTVTEEGYKLEISDLRGRAIELSV